MSQHMFHFKDLSVQCGWDRPLGHHFLTVCRAGDEDDFVYCNLYDPALGFGGGMTAEQVVMKLAELQIPVPTGLPHALLEDKVKNAGNDVKYWEL